MDLKFLSYKSRFKVTIWLFFVTGLCFSYANSWRISQKCPHGHYFNDGCTACWCDTRSGQTKCERLSRCAGLQLENDKCPRGHQFKDNCGNDCTCYESTGAVFCNEKRRCPPEIIRNVVPISVQVQTTTESSVGFVSVHDNQLMRRGGYAASTSNSGQLRGKQDIIRHRPSSSSTTTTPPPPYRRYSTIPPLKSSTTRRPNIFEGISVSSTPRPQLRIPVRGQSRSEELIIEPAIVIRKRGSNRVNIIRNPSAATSTSLTLSSRRRNPLLGGKRYPSDKSSQSLPKANPLLLYEKQIRAIMEMKKAYAKLLGSKVNFNFQLATGQVGNPQTITLHQQQPPVPVPVQQSSQQAQNNGLFFFQNKLDQFQSSTTEHPRRFDVDYENSTVLMNIPTSTPPPISYTSQQPKPLISLSMSTPFFWHKEHIKNTIKQFSPVQPLQQLVSYVSSSTENYLSQFLNHLSSRNKQINQETTTKNPVYSLAQPPSTSYYQPSTNTPPSFIPVPTTAPAPPPPPIAPYQSYSTIPPYSGTFQDPSLTPIHEVYQNHHFKNLLPHPTQPSRVAPPVLQYHPNGSPYQHQLSPQQFGNNIAAPNPKTSDTSPHFPFISDIIREIAREDNGIPIATPRTSPALTALPTFQTPGPPYAEVDVVQPLSFLPPPKPEPATPTRRILPSLQNLLPNNLRPTVRVNLDKPIFLPQPQNYHPQHQATRHPHRPVQHQQALPHRPIKQHQTRPTGFFFPSILQQNRRNYHRPQPPPVPPNKLHYAPPPHRYNPQPQFYMPRPKQYRLVLKGPMRDAAVRMDNVVPNFVQKIAHEFFKKPEIYVPKIRPGKPLTLEKIVLNHKEMVPTELMFAPTTPGSVQPPMTKLRFTPEAQWEMKEELAKHGIMLNEPLTNPIRDYALNDPNIMEMDTPIRSVQTWEAHSDSNAGVDPLPETGFSMNTGGGGGGGMYSIGSSILPTQHNINEQQFPVLSPSPTTPPSQQFLQPPIVQQDHQHQQEIQQQLLLAQQNQQHQFTASSGTTNDNDNAFSVDPNDFNDFSQVQQLQHQHQSAYPSELSLPGVQEVVVDKYIVHDPMDPLQPIKTYSTTTVRPPTTTIENRVDLSPILTNPHRTGLLQYSGQGVPEPAPSVLIRHHGAPSSTTVTPVPLPPVISTMSTFPQRNIPSDNFMVTVINSTPRPHMVTTTIAPYIFDMPSSLQINYPSAVNNHPTDSTKQTESIAGQIHDFLSDHMDFGARPQVDLFDGIFHSRTGPLEMTGPMESEENLGMEFHDQIAIESRLEHTVVSQRDDDGKIDESVEIDKNVETDKLANIFSIDYKSKYDRKPPEVIVIKVPPEHSDGPFPKIVEKRKGAQLEIQGGALGPERIDNDSESDTSTEIKSSTDTSAVQGESEEETQSKSSRRQRKRKKKRRRKSRRKNKNRDNDFEQVEEPVTINQSSTARPEHHRDITSNDQSVKKDESNAEDIISSTRTSLGLNVAEEKFNEELDWKSKLMANICELNPSSPLCLTYRSICLLMTSED